LSDDSEEEYQEENEESYGACDSCNQYDAVTKCSLFDEEIDHGVIQGEICADCCESAFESDPVSCVQLGDECPRVKGLQLATLEKVAREKNYKKSDKIPGIYLDSMNAIGIGVFETKPETAFNDTVIPVDAFYTGREYDFAKAKEQRYAYPRDSINEALSILKRLGEDDLKYGILSKSGILAIQGYSAWSVASGLAIDWPYMLETRDFLKNMRNGYAIFEDDVRKEIKLVDLATEASLDWNKLEPRQFEELCADILDSFDSISDCVLTGAVGDEGRDIKAKEKVETIAGVELRNWLVQCKHFPSRPVGRQDIEDLNTLHTRFKFDVYCIMTSGTFGPNAIRLLEEYEKEGYTIRYMERRILEKRIREVPSLLGKFCSLIAK
jgi:hypothetical protein